jgi:hypothetical protein
MPVIDVEFLGLPADQIGHLRQLLAVAFGKGRNLPLLHAGKVAPEPLVGHAVLRHDLLDGAQGRGRAVRRGTRAADYLGGSSFLSFLAS